MRTPRTISDTATVPLPSQSPVQDLGSQDGAGLVFTPRKISMPPAFVITKSGVAEPATSATVILALTPAALGYSAGADTNGPLAVAVIGGMFSSTLLTLVVVPAVYSLIENRLQRHHAAVARSPNPAGLR